MAKLKIEDTIMLVNLKNSIFLLTSFRKIKFTFIFINVVLVELIKNKLSLKFLSKFEIAGALMIITSHKIVVLILASFSF